MVEAFDLAYHGDRTNDPTFNLALETKLDEEIKHIHASPADLTRVFINLFSNGIYATKLKKSQVMDGTYQPKITIASKIEKNGVEIRVRDNGTGINESTKGRMFTPFFTNKPKDQGTGLGLSIVHDIICNQHSGRINVESLEGEFTEFILWIPDTPP